MLVSALYPSGSAVPLGKTISLEIKMDLDVPADTFQGTFLVSQEPSRNRQNKASPTTGHNAVFPRAGRRTDF